MTDDIARSAVRDADDPAIRSILDEVCRVTGMGFAAVARVTEDRWIAAQVLDKIAFGLHPGDELDISTTICADIRDRGRAVVIDHVADDPTWRTHPTPMLYGFESYVSYPITLRDGSFWGTLCAIDPHPRRLSGRETVAVLERCARDVAEIIRARVATTG